MERGKISYGAQGYLMKKLVLHGWCHPREGALVSKNYIYKTISYVNLIY